MDQLTKSCLSYLSEHKILCKLMEGFTEKYRSFGTVCGNVTLTRLREEDIEILEGFFGKSFHGKKKTTISASTVSKAIANSCYAGCDLNDIVCAFQSEQLLTHKEMKEKYQLEQKQFFEKILEKHHDTVFAQWLKKVLRTKDAPFSYLVKQYNVNKDLLEKQCNWIAKALNYLPVERDRYEYLAIFATNIMGDPHGFDEGTTNMLLLRYGILFYIDKTEKISNDFEQNSIQQGIGDKGEIVGRSNENCYLPIKHVNKLSAEEKQE
ncbi:MAG: TIGR02679 domain-containing protein, partial [Eubacteriales bacterium]